MIAMLGTHVQINKHKQIEYEVRGKTLWGQNPPSKCNLTIMLLLHVQNLSCNNLHA